MRKLHPTQSERRRQPPFSIADLGAIAGVVALVLCIFAFDRWMGPKRVGDALGARTALVTFDRVSLGRTRLGPARLAGAWRLRSRDPRFGGLSALGFDRGSLLAITDAGAIVRLPLPRGGQGLATIRELPAGPSDGRLKRNRDAEALLRDPAGRGWWVAFERHHQLWLYDPAFTRAVGAPVQLPGRSWDVNGGVEAMAAARDGLLLLVESGPSALLLRKGRLRPLRLSGQRGTLTDAVALPGGGLLAIDRELTPFGFRTRLVRLAQTRKGVAVVAAVRLPVGPIDNIEGIAAQPLVGGGTRLWLISDDNFQLPYRTLLTAIDLPA